MNPWKHVESAIADALSDGWLVDYRTKLPRHKTRQNRRRECPDDVLGVCSHQSGSVNQDPVRTANYHVGPNHVSSKGCPTLLYNFVITRQERGKVLLAVDPVEIVSAQGQATRGREEWAGDENRHLLPILIMGDFSEMTIGRRGFDEEPSPDQIDSWYQLTSWLSKVFSFRGNGYFGHYHFGKSACPGMRVRRLTEDMRRDVIGFANDRQWQEALLRWDETCLPRWGADGVWGFESQRALVNFERAHKHRTDGLKDPFTELLLGSKYA